MLNSYHPRVSTDASYHPSHTYHPMDPSHHYYHAEDEWDAQDDRLERHLLLGGAKQTQKLSIREYEMETRAGSLILMGAHLLSLGFAGFLIYLTRTHLDSDYFSTLYLSWTALALSCVIILVSLAALYEVYKFLRYSYPGNALVLNHFLSMFLIILLCIYTCGILRYWHVDETIMEHEFHGMDMKTWYILLGIALIGSHLMIMIGTLRVKFHDAVRVSIYKWTSFLSSLILLFLCVAILFFTILVACSYGKVMDLDIRWNIHQTSKMPLEMCLYSMIVGTFLLLTISIVGVAAPFHRPHAHVRLLIWAFPLFSYPLLGFSIPAYIYCHVDDHVHPTCDNYFLLLSILMALATQPFVIMGATAYYAWKRYAYRHKPMIDDMY